jgi:hypothetical protein
MHREIIGFGSAAVIAFCLCVASDAKAATPFINPSVTSATVTFPGDNFTPGGTVWVGLSTLSGQQKCIWSTTGSSWGFLGVTESLTSSCACGNGPYEAWAYDWSTNQTSNIVVVTPECPQ